MAVVSDKYRDKCAEYLTKFREISVREESGSRIIRELTGRTAPVVLDPVFLIDADEWRKVSLCPRQSGYVLLFMLRYDEILAEKAGQYAEKNGLKLVNIRYTAGKCKGAINVAGISPEAWIGYFAGAAAVFTNSFHGTAFSLIFNKQFTVGLDNLGKESRNSRIVDLLTRIGADKAFGSDPEAYIDYGKVNIRIGEERTRSLDILSGMLDGGVKS